jgi:hypothetical protein
VSGRLGELTVLLFKVCEILNRFVITRLMNVFENGLALRKEVDERNHLAYGG